jgi:hypothetical protein
MYMLAPMGSYRECDVGPTVHPGGSGVGVPAPDDSLDFEDLMIFGMNYGIASPRAVPFLPMPEAAGALSLSLAERSASSGAVEFSLVLTGNVDEVKGLSVEVLFDPGALAFESARLSEGMASPLGDVFFWGGGGEGGVQLDLAVLGKGVTLRGSGEVAVLTFAQAGGVYSLELDAAKLRDAENRPLVADVEGYQSAPTVPSKFHLQGNAPNPFRASTSIAYEVPHKTDVSIRVHDVSGRLVRTLVGRVVGPGRHAVAWDGRNDDGEAVGSGVYFCSMDAGVARIAQRKIVLTR